MREIGTESKRAGQRNRENQYQYYGDTIILIDFFLGKYLICVTDHCHCIMERETDGGKDDDELRLNA